MKQFLAFIRLSRLHFLPLSILTHAVGLAWVRREHRPIDYTLLAQGLAIQLLVQLSAAYINDYWDRPTDRINTRRTLLSGGSGELTTGILPPYTALIAAAVCQSTALVWALWARVPAASYPILASVIAVAIFYTTPPLKLAWRGWGEFTTACVAALLVPQWAYTLQLGRMSTDLLVVQLPLLPFIMSFFVAIAAPDYDADRRVHKRTLPVILGAAHIGLVYGFLIALGYGAGIVCWRDRAPGAVLAAMLFCFPLTIWAWAGLHFQLHTHPRPVLLILRAGMIPLVLLTVMAVTLYSA